MGLLQWSSTQAHDHRCSSTGTILKKVFIRQLKINSAHMDNDETGCYDRIIVSLGMIACQRLGMPSSAVQTQAEAL
jgi:hypothetical protein